MTEYFCNECSTNKKKGCTISWPDSWKVDDTPDYPGCDSQNPFPRWRKVIRTKTLKA